MDSDRQAEFCLDLSGLKCPLPVLRTRKMLRKMAAGATLRVICTDPLAGIDIPHLVIETGDVLQENIAKDGKLVFVIRRAGSHAKAQHKAGP